MKKQLLVAAALAGALGCTSAAAEDWQFALTPYLWFPTVTSTVQYSLPAGIGGGSATVQKDASDYLSSLDMALMLNFEARKGRWAIFTDYIYLDFSDDTSSVKTLTGPGGTQVPINTGTQAGLKGAVWELAASYAISESKTSSFEVLGGFRYTKLEPSVSWQLAGPLGMFPQAGSLSQKEELWDAIVGVRGKAKFGEGGRWFVPWYLDVGAGDSQLTWQTEVGIGYAFKWGDVLLAYRYLSYEQKAGKPMQELEMGGPALGVTFRW